MFLFIHIFTCPCYPSLIFYALLFLSVCFSSLCHLIPHSCPSVRTLDRKNSAFTALTQRLPPLKVQKVKLLSQGHLICPIPWCSLYSFHKDFELKVLALKKKIHSLVRKTWFFVSISNAYEYSSYQWPLRPSISSLRLPSLRCFREGSQLLCSPQRSLKSTGSMMPKTYEGHYPKFGHSRI